MRFPEQALRAYRVAGQNHLRVVARHRTAGCVEDLVRDTARLITHQQDVFSVNALQRVWLFGPRCPGRYEIAFGCRGQFDPVLLDREQLPHIAWHLPDPRLHFRQKRIHKLARGRRGDHDLRSEPRHQKPYRGPSEQRRLAYAVPGADRYLALAGTDHIQHLRLPGIGGRLEVRFNESAGVFL